MQFWPLSLVRTVAALATLGAVVCSCGSVTGFIAKSGTRSDEKTQAAGYGANGGPADVTDPSTPDGPPAQPALPPADIAGIYLTCGDVLGAKAPAPGKRLVGCAVYGAKHQRLGAAAEIKSVVMTSGQKNSSATCRPATDKTFWDALCEVDATVLRGDLVIVAMVSFSGAEPVQLTAVPDMALFPSAQTGCLSPPCALPVGGAAKGFVTPTTVSTAVGSFLASAIGFGDFDGDGRLDMVVGEQSLGTVVDVLTWRGGTFAVSQSLASPGIGSILDLATGDLNGDGILDIVTGKTGYPVQVNLGRGDGTFGPSLANTFGDPSTYETKALALGDLNGDGRLDLVLGNGSGNNPQLERAYLGLGDGRFAAGRDVGSELNATPDVVLADANGDGKLDILVATNGAASLVYLGRGDGAFAAALPINPGETYQTSAIAAGDLNRDGKLDVVLAQNGVPLRVFSGKGDGTFDAGVTVSSDVQNLYAIAVADMNGDGSLDIVVGAYSGGLNKVYLGNGAGKFAAGVTLSEGPVHTDALGIADFNGDGLLDVLSSEGEPSDPTSQSRKICFGK